VLCKCKRGQAVVNYKMHIYEFITDEDQEKYYNKSINRFQTKYNNTYSNVNVKNIENGQMRKTIE